MNETQELIRNVTRNFSGIPNRDLLAESYGESVPMPEGLGALRFADSPGLRSGIADALRQPFETPTADNALVPVGKSIDSEQAAKQWIIQKESEGKTTAKNPNSSAFGLGQLIRTNREAYAKKLGVDPDTTDYNAQSKMQDMYVKDRYGTYQKAKEFWEKNGWY